MSVLVYLLARRMFSAEIALTTLIALNAIPLAADASFLMTQDPVQLLFWAATVYVVWLAIEPASDLEPLSDSARNGLWLLGGVLAALRLWLN